MSSMSEIGLGSMNIEIDQGDLVQSRIFNGAMEICQLGIFIYTGKWTCQKGLNMADELSYNM
jgi:hypothetical protein